MQENEIRALYCRTMGALHCPPGLTAPRRRRRRPAAALCAVGLAACGAVAAGGVTLHNLHYFLNLMRRIRASIEAGTFEELRREFQ